MGANGQAVVWANSLKLRQLTSAAFYRYNKALRN